MLKKIIAKDPTVLLRGGLILLTILFIGADVFVIKFFNGNETEDVLSSCKISKDEEAKAIEYVKFITSSVNSKGYSAIDSKWVEDMPPSFRKNAKEKIESLNIKKFTVKRVGSDRKDLYTVKCEALSKEKDIVFFDIIKTKDGKLNVLKLLRIY